MNELILGAAKYFLGIILAILFSVVLQYIFKSYQKLYMPIKPTRYYSVLLIVLGNEAAVTGFAVVDFVRNNVPLILNSLEESPGQKGSTCWSG